MAREALQRASEELRDASERATGEVQRRLYDQSNQLANLADRDRGPDHGRLARHQNALSEIRDDADDEEVREHITAAKDAISEYREGVEGV